MNETSAAYLNLMNRLASQRAQRLRDVAQISGQAQAASSQAWAQLPVQLAGIATNAMENYRQDKAQAEMIRLRDVAAQNEAARIGEMERHNTAVETQTAARDDARMKADADKERVSLGEKYLSRHAPTLLTAGAEALRSRDGYVKNRAILDAGNRAISATIGQTYQPLPEEPDETTLATIQQLLPVMQGYAPAAEYRQVGSSLVKVGPDGVTPVYTAPTQTRPVQVDTVDASGRPVTRFVEPKAGDEFPAPPKAASGGGGDQGSGYTMPEVISTRPPKDVGNKQVPGTLLTANGVFQGAIDLALTGKSPSFARATGKFSQLVPATQAAVRNSAAELMANSGMDAGILRAAYAANAKTLGTMIPRYNQSVAFADSALASLNFAEAAGEKVKRGPTSALNTLRNWWNRDIAGNKELSEFEVYVYSAARDYAKVTSGAEASVAELSISAANKADQLLNVAQSPERFAGAVQAMRQDMANAVENRRAKIGETSKVIADFLFSVNPPPVTPEDYAGRVLSGGPNVGSGVKTAPTASGPSLSYQDYLKRRKGGQ